MSQVRQTSSDYTMAENNHDMAAEKEHEAASESPPTKPNILKKYWQKADIKLIQVLLAMKGAIPPTIALAAYQSPAWAAKYSTIGYLVAITSTLSLAMLPRGKFLNAMVANIFFICLACGVCVFQIQTVIWAREASVGRIQSVYGRTPAPNEYDSDAAAVSALWLFFQLWLANTVRSKLPQLQVPVILYLIFVIVTSTTCIRFPTMSYGLQFMRRMLETFLTGMGLATGVNLVIFPLSVRTTASKQMVGVFGLMKASIMAHAKFLNAVATEHELRKKETLGQDAPVLKKKKSKPEKTKSETAAHELREINTKLGTLFTALRLDLTIARKEIGYGKLSPEEYTAIEGHLTTFLAPLIGQTTFIDVVKAIFRGYKEATEFVKSTDEIEALHKSGMDEWKEALSLNVDAYQAHAKVMAAGLTHMTYVLELDKPPKKKATTDTENTAGADPKPGDAGFAEYFEVQAEKFHKSREDAIRQWCGDKGIDLPGAFWEDPAAKREWSDFQGMEEVFHHKRNQQQFYLFLYLEYLAHTLSRSILAGVKYADSKIADGTMKKKRWIFPGWRRLHKALKTLWTPADSDDIGIEGQITGAFVDLGDSYKTKRNPEHLEPETSWEKSTNWIRAFPKFMASDESAFGFRAAVAAMSIGVIAFIRQTNVFFLAQRGTWALIMTGISMSPNAGQGIFGFLFRVLGSLIAMILCFPIFYCGGQVPGGIIPLTWFFISCFLLFLLKKPEWAMISIISSVTIILVVGYEMQEDVIGYAATVSSGQPFYPIYLLAPYRLLTVIVGLTTAFIWTYFPYPVTTHSTLRKDLGASLYLLANYYSTVHTTIETKIREGSAVKNPPKGSPMARLDKVRVKVFAKFLMKLGQLRGHSAMTKWEPTFGGRFPVEIYDELIDSMRDVWRYMTLMVFSSNAFMLDAEDPEHDKWVQDFRKFAAEVTLTSHEVTSTLCLISASILNQQPLPPYMHAPQPYALRDRLQKVDPAILSVKHINDPFYAAFAVLEISSTLVSQEMEKVLRLVKKLVGESDFSFHIVSTKSDTASTTSTRWEKSSGGSNFDSDGEKTVKKD